jgi:DNA-binding NtrC family response regulator
LSKTLDDSDALDDRSGRPAVPGALLIWSQRRPVCVPFAFKGGALELGRDELDAAGLSDGRVSRAHLHLERTDAGWRCTDRGSRNGTWVDGVRCERTVERADAVVVRVGQTLLLTVDDVRAFDAPAVHETDERVAGPAMRAVFARLEAFAKGGAHVLLQGPSGAGKEVAARAFHRASASGPMVSVNCATVPRELAERMLFGARRGAFTGATDASGLLQQADGGTLFLDEVAELDLPVQAKLLRALETQTVVPLGATQPVAARFRLVSATLRDLREAVREGRFREDLYYRLGRPTVRIPSLVERREELGYHIARTLRALGPDAPRCSATFVEACLLRPWPGNVRELGMEVHAAALEAKAAREDLDASSLDPNAGRALGPLGLATSNDDARVSDDASAQGVATPPQEVVWEALVRTRGNVAQTAQALGLSRARLRRLIERWSLDVGALRGP